MIGTGVYISDLDVLRSEYRNIFLGLVAAGAVLLIGLAFGLGRSISKPIQSLVASTRSLAAGDLSIAIEGTSRRDEIGQMAGSVQVFKEAIVAKKLADEQSAIDAHAKTRLA